MYFFRNDTLFDSLIWIDKGILEESVYFILDSVSVRLSVPQFLTLSLSNFFGFFNLYKDSKDSGPEVSEGKIAFVLKSFSVTYVLESSVSFFEGFSMTLLLSLFLVCSDRHASCFEKRLPAWKFLSALWGEELSFGELDNMFRPIGFFGWELVS